MNVPGLTPLLTQIPMIAQLLFGAGLTAVWIYAIYHLYFRSGKTGKPLILWSVIVLIVPFGFLFYITSNLDLEE